MTHIVKITQVGHQWRIEDWKQRWVQIAHAVDIKCGSHDATTYGNVFPFSYEWHWLEMIKFGKANEIYHHARWLGTEWSLAGSCNNPKRTW